MAVRTSERDTLARPKVVPSGLPRVDVVDHYDHVFQRFLGWCWAACIEMAKIILSGGFQESKEEIVQTALPCQGCQNSSVPNSCKQGLDPARLVDAWQSFQVDVREEARLDPGPLEDLLAAHQTAQVVYNADHVVLVVGRYWDSENVMSYVVADPICTRQTIQSYEEIAGTESPWTSTILPLRIAP